LLRSAGEKNSRWPQNRFVISKIIPLIRGMIFEVWISSIVLQNVQAYYWVMSPTHILCRYNRA